MTEVSGVMYAPKVLAAPTPSPYESRYPGCLCFVVESPAEFNRDHPEINGKHVLLAWHGEAAVYVVKAVHRHLPSIPIQPGERIGLIVEPVDA